MDRRVGWLIGLGLFGIYSQSRANDAFDGARLLFEKLICDMYHIYIFYYVIEDVIEYKKAQRNYKQKKY
jgi:hypothetical protein